MTILEWWWKIFRKKYFFGGRFFPREVFCRIFNIMTNDWTLIKHTHTHTYQWFWWTKTKSPKESNNEKKNFKFQFGKKSGHRTRIYSQYYNFITLMIVLQNLFVFFFHWNFSCSFQHSNRNKTKQILNDHTQ